MQSQHTSVFLRRKICEDDPFHSQIFPPRNSILKIFSFHLNIFKTGETDFLLCVKRYFFFSLANFLSYLCVELSKWGIFYINQEKIKRRRRKGQCTNKCTEKIAEVLLILSNIPFYYNSTYALRSMNHFYYGNLNSI